MDEKIVNLLIKNGCAVDTCLSGVNVAMKALCKQERLNRLQRILNITSGILLYLCVSNIVDLKVKVKNLEAKNKSEEQTEEGA